MRYLLLLFFLCFFSSLFALEDLEKTFSQDYILSTHKIELPGYPHAFNPSLVRWKDSLLLSFRIVPDPNFSFLSWIGFIWLDDNFQPKGRPFILNLRESSLAPSRIDDARLITVGQKLYLVYSDNTEQKISKKGFRVHLTEILYKDNRFVAKKPISLTSFEGESQLKREKNWVPFDYKGELLLSYSLFPHRILKPLNESGECETLFETHSQLLWKWGEPRGGTAAILQGKEYLAFFHSSKEMATIHSFGKPILHYFMGAYTFSAEPPFQIKRISPFPIVGKGFYHGAYYRPYWKPVRVVFPCGILSENNWIWITYGREDHEIWIAKLDKTKLLKSLQKIAS